MSICPRHRDAFGMRWRSGKRTCSAPKDWAAHKSKQVKGDRGITLPQQIKHYGTWRGSGLG